MRFLFIPFILFYCTGFCQTDTLHSTDEKVLALKLDYGNVLVHTKAVENIKGSMPYGIEIEYSKQKINDSTFNLCNCYPRSGVVASYFNLDNKILGSAFMLAYFLEPNYRLADKLQFALRGSIGLTYATNPFDAIKNPGNHNYPLPINPYLQIGAALNYKLNKHVNVAAMYSLQHFSNGGFKEPNRGVNWTTLSLGMLYYSGNNYMPKYKRTINNFWKGKPPLIDVGFMYVPQQGYSSRTMAQRAYLYGIFTQLTKQVGRTSALTAGAEIYNSKLVENPVTAKNQNASPYFAGVHAGHAFLLGRVIFRQQIGAYIFDQTTYFEKVYLRFGLDYKLSKHFLIGINLKSHSDNADFTDARVMYRF